MLHIGEKGALGGYHVHSPYNVTVLGKRTRTTKPSGKNKGTTTPHPKPMPLLFIIDQPSRQDYFNFLVKLALNFHHFRTLNTSISHFIDDNVIMVRDLNDFISLKLLAFLVS
jgi:hypothetical protein